MNTSLATLNEAGASSIKDIIDIFRNQAQKSQGSDYDRGGQYLGGSISRYSRDLVMSFPLMIDSSLEPSIASMINKANERNIVTMLQLLFSSVSLRANNGVEVLKMFHRNIDNNMDIEDIINAIDNIAGTAKSFGENVQFSARNEKILSDILKEMTQSLSQEPTRYPESSFSEKSLNDYLVYNTTYGINVREAPVIKEAKDEPPKFDPQRQTNYNDSFDRDLNLNRLTQVDIRKSNELQPTLLVINYNNYDENRGVVVEKKSFVAGVKSRLIAVDPLDIVERFLAKNRNKIDFKNIIRATTGEIGFVDFLLNAKQAKLAAKNDAKNSNIARMWNALQSKSIKNAGNKALRAGNDATAITGIVVSQPIVEHMKKIAKFDLEQVNSARLIMREYNLLSIIIVDPMKEVAKFLYDGNSVFETLSFSALERENNDSSTKKLINLLNMNK